MADDMDSGPFLCSKRSVEGSPVPEPSSSEIVSPLKPEQDRHTKLSPGFRVDENINMGSSVGIEVGLSRIQEPKAAGDLLDMKKKQLLEQVEALVAPPEKKPDPSSSSSSLTCLKVEVIDETALIETVNGNKAKNQTRKEKVANGIKIKKSSGVGAKISYSRKELEAMRFVSPAQQKKLWKHVYNGLGPLVAKEYDDLAVSKNHNNKNIQFSNDHRKRFAAPGIFGELLGNSVNNETQDVSLPEPVCSYNVTNEDEYPFPEQECCEDDDSDEEYASIQRPAFLVEGEPNFNSGSPEDGFEYLRRVRWEAARIPKVRVAKVDRSKFNREQSDYMPKIPEIAKCPEQLLPLKQWEDAFLSEYSELRLCLSRFESSSASTSQDLQGVIFHKNCSSHQPPVDTIYEDFACVKSMELDCIESFNYPPSLLTAEGGTASPLVGDYSPKDSGDNIYRSSPLLSVIFRLDSVARVSMLRKRVKAAEDTSTLSRDDCLWLFALCATVDTPLDADTSASVRSLLRKCAALRATKSTQDDELIMLNILVTVAGRYFGQLEN